VTDTRVAASTHPANREARRHPATHLLAEESSTMSAANSAKVLGISLNTLMPRLSAATSEYGPSATASVAHPNRRPEAPSRA
jgi:hypothetical protein